MRQSFNSPDGPPLTIARVEYRVFLNRIKELEDQIFGETCDAMHEWLDVADSMGVRAQTEDGFRTRIKAFCNDLTIAGMTVLTDYAIPLRDADRIGARPTRRGRGSFRQSKRDSMEAIDSGKIHWDFKASQTLDVENRKARALEYIAYTLDRIDLSLAKIAFSLTQDPAGSMSVLKKRSGHCRRAA